MQLQLHLHFSPTSPIRGKGPLTTMLNLVLCLSLLVAHPQVQFLLLLKLSSRSFTYKIIKLLQLTSTKARGRFWQTPTTTTTTTTSPSTTRPTPAPVTDGPFFTQHGAGQPRENHTCSCLKLSQSQSHLDECNRIQVSLQSLEPRYHGALRQADDLAGKLQSCQNRVRILNLRPLSCQPPPTCPTHRAPICPTASTRPPSTCPPPPSCKKCPEIKPCPIVGAPSPFIAGCPPCPPIPYCPTPKPCPNATVSCVNPVQAASRNARVTTPLSTSITPRTDRTIRATDTTMTPLPSPMPLKATTSEPSHFDIYQVKSDWQSNINSEDVHFRDEGKLVGELGFIHVVHDFPLQEYLDQGSQLCSKVIEKALFKAANQTHHAKFYRTLLTTYKSRCSQIVNGLQNERDVFISGSHSHMYNRYQKPHSGTSTDTEPGFKRDKRQLVIIGAALLVLGIIAVGTYLFSNMKVAELSVSSYTNPATIKTLTKHEARLNIDEDDITTLVEATNETIQQQNTINTDEARMQYFHQIDVILNKFQWQFYQLGRGLEELRNGKLSTLLVLPDKLETTLQNFRTKMMQKGFHTVITDVHEIYQCETSFLVFKNNTIRSITHVPMFRQDSLLNVYRYLPLPMEIQGHFIYFQPSNMYIAANQEKTLFRTFSEVAFQNCKVLNDLRYCYTGNSFMKQPLDCLSSLFELHEHDVIEQCPIRVERPKDIAVQLSYSSAIVYHAAQQEIALSCKMATPVLSTISFKGFKKFDIPPSCRLESATLLIDGTEELWTNPAVVHSFTPDLDHVPKFKTFLAHMNQSSNPLGTIKSQKALRIDDINALFEHDKLMYTYGLTIAGVFGIFISCCLFCCICYCCRKWCPNDCCSTLTRTRRRSSRRGRSVSPPRSRGDIPMREMQRTSSIRSIRPLRNPARKMNMLYREQ